MSSLKGNLSETIANIIRQEILTGKYTEGTHLAEKDIAERFGISRGPVREMFNTLRVEGFVYTMPNGRTHVSTFSMEDMNHFYNIRYHVESESLKIILKNAKGDSYTKWLKTLEDLLEQSRFYMKKNEVGGFTDLDIEFHYSFLKRADVKAHMLVWKIIENTTRSIMEVNRQHLFEKGEDYLEPTYNFHDEILIGLKNRDLGYVLQKLKIHMDNGATNYATLIAER